MATARGADSTYSVTDAAFSMPVVLIPSAEAEGGGDVIAEVVSGAVAAHAAAVGLRVEGCRAFPFSAPIVLHEVVITHATRIDLRPEPHVPATALPTLFAFDQAHVALPLVMDFELHRMAQLHEVLRSLQRAAPGIHQSVASTLITLIVAQPCVLMASGGGRAGRSYGDFERDAPHDAAHKRASWSKEPVIDIAKHIPQFTDDMHITTYLRTVQSAIHSDLATKLPQLLREESPFQALMQAILLCLAEGSKMVARNIKDVSVAKALEAAHKTTTQKYGHSVAAARQDPSPLNLRAFADYCAAGLRDVRAVLVNRTSPQGQMAYDADALMAEVREANADSMLDFICMVDTAFNNYRTLMGDALLFEACSTGLLTGFLTGFVSRLSTHYQDKAVMYWNNVARMFMCDGPQRDALPPGFRRRLDELIAEAGATNDIAPNFSALARFDGQVHDERSVAAYANLAQVCAADARSPLVRVMHAPTLHRTPGRHPIYSVNAVEPTRRTS